MRKGSLLWKRSRRRPEMAGRGRPFERGNQVGRGRPPGSRNKSGHRHEELLLEYAEALTRKMLSEALKGDKQSLRFCLERVLPASRERPVRMPAPKIATAEDMVRAAGNVWNRMFKGQCTPGEAEKMI